MTYSLATLKWGLETCHDSNVAQGVVPFAKASPAFWSRTSGHPVEVIEQVMQQVVADRSTRIPPNSDIPVEGK